MPATRRRTASTTSTTGPHVRLSQNFGVAKTTTNAPCARARPRRRLGAARCPAGCSSSARRRARRPASASSTGMRGRRRPATLHGRRRRRSLLVGSACRRRARRAGSTCRAPGSRGRRRRFADPCRRPRAAPSRCGTAPRRGRERATREPSAARSAGLGASGRETRPPRAGCIVGRAHHESDVFARALPERVERPGPGSFLRCRGGVVRAAARGAQQKTKGQDRGGTHASTGARGLPGAVGEAEAEVAQQRRSEGREESEVGEASLHHCSPPLVRSGSPGAPLRRDGRRGRPRGRHHGASRGRRGRPRRLRGG